MWGLGVLQAVACCVVTMHVEERMGVGVQWDVGKRVVQWGVEKRVVLWVVECGGLRQQQVKVLPIVACAC